MDFYLVPRIGDGLTPRTAYKAKYFQDATTGASLIESGQFINLNYGPEPFYFVLANTTETEHNTISANGDAMAFPRGTDDPVSVIELNALRQRLEEMRFPAQWVTTSNTRRQVLRVIVQLCQFASRFRIMEGEGAMVGGATLNTRMNQLTAGQRQALERVADSFGLDSSGIGSTTTIGEALKLLADQMPIPRITGEGIDETI